MYQLDNQSIINCNGDITIMNENTSKQLLKMSNYFIMKEVCEMAQVNYGTFRNWKSNPDKYALNEEFALKLLETMKEITKEIK